VARTSPARPFPDARVVKALNMVNHEIMVDPSRLSGDHDLFLAGNDDAAKTEARGLLESFGWPTESIHDLGDLSGARGMEAYLLLWLRLWRAFGTSALNIRVVR
jgi:hypothetical protein